MEVRIMIARAANSPTQKVWGCIFPSQGVATDAAIFYGPGNKMGGSVYRKPRNTAIRTFNKKTRDEYSPVLDSLHELDDATPLDKVAGMLLKGLQQNRFLPDVIAGLRPKQTTTQPESPKAQDPRVTSERIRATISQIQPPDWAF